MNTGKEQCARRAINHFCAFYQTDAGFTASVAMFLRPWLEEGRKVVYIADSDTLETAWERVEQTGLDCSGCRSSGALEVVLAGSLFSETGPVRAKDALALLQRTADGMRWENSGLGLISEKSWALSLGMPGTELLEYEARVNTLVSQNRFDLACLYDERCFESEILLEVLRTHPYVVSGHATLQNDGYLPPEDYLSPGRKYLEFKQELNRLESRQADPLPDFCKADIKNLLDALPMVIHTHDAAGGYGFWNKESERVLGYTAEEVAAHKDIGERLFPDAGHRTRLQELAADWGYGDIDQDVEFIAKNGGKRTINLRRRFALSQMPEWRVVEAGIDVTGCKAIQEELAASKRRLDLVIENVPAGFCLVDRSLRFCFANTRYASRFGKRPEEIIGLPVEDVVGGEYFAAVSSAMHQALAGETLEFEFVVKPMEGGEQVVRIHYIPNVVSGGPVDGFVAMILDVSAQKRTEKALQESELRFRTYLEEAADALFLCELSGQVREVNRRAAECLGYTHEELRSMNVADLDAKLNHGVTRACYERQLLEEKRIGFESELQRKDGAFIPVETYCSLFEIDGELLVLGQARDISERLRARAEREELLARFRVIFEYSMDGILVVTMANLRFTYANPAINAMLGHEAGEWNRLHFFDVFKRDTGAFFCSGEKDPVAFLLSSRSDVGFARKNGTLFYGDTNGTKAVIDGRESIILFVRDATKRRADEEQLRHSLEFQARIMEASPDVITRLDSQGRVEFVSSRGVKLLGMEHPEQFIGTRAHDWIDPSYHTQLEENMREILNMGYDWQHTTNEYLFRLRDGRTFTAAICSSPFVDENGEVTGLVSVIRDVSEQKLMEQELKAREKRQRELVETLHEGLEVIDRSGKILFVNKKLCELIGYDREELLGRRFIDFVPPEDREQFRAQVVKHNVTSVRKYEILFPKKDGEKRAFLVTHHPMADETGRITGSFGVISDITEEKHLAQRKEDVDRLIRQELRAPFNGVLSLTHLMLMDKAGGRCVDYATELNAIANKMLRLIDLSREIFRMEQGEYEPSFAWFDFREVFRNIDRFITPEADIKLVRVIYHHESGSGLGELPYFGEQVLLESMLINLVKNAVEAAHDKEEVTVIFEGLENEVQISVHHYGYLEEDTRRRFFEKYSSSGTKKGSGLSTYSAKLIAEAHGGNITVESDKEQGTIVCVTLPHLRGPQKLD